MILVANFFNGSYTSVEGGPISIDVLKETLIKNESVRMIRIYEGDLRKPGPDNKLVESYNYTKLKELRS